MENHDQTSYCGLYGGVPTCWVSPLDDEKKKPKEPKKGNNKKTNKQTKGGAIIFCSPKPVIFFVTSVCGSIRPHIII